MKCEKGFFESAFVVWAPAFIAGLVHGCHASADLGSLTKAYNARHPKPVVKVVEKPVTVTKTLPAPAAKTVYVDKPVVVEKQVVVPTTQIDVHLGPGEGVAIHQGKPLTGKAAAQRYMNWKAKDDALADLEEQRLQDEIKRHEKFTF